MKVAIIGAGISGLTVGRLFKEKKIHACLYESKDRPGGLIQCDLIEGFLFHKVGGHVFNSKDDRVLDWFWRFFDRESEFVAAQRNAKIYLSGAYVGYPIENHLYQLNPSIGKRVVNDLLFLLKDAEKSPDNFEDFLFSKFGQTLCDIYFLPYNKKIWQSDLSEISLDWLEGKLPNPTVNEIFESNIFRENETKMVHSSFYYPKSGGSQFLVDRFSNGLDIRCNTPVNRIQVVSGGLLVNNEFFEKVVYTGDIRKLGSTMHYDDPHLSTLLDKATGLISHGTSNILCECDKSDISWLYLPEGNSKAHRIIYTGGFAASNNGSSHRSSCVVEFSGQVSSDVMTAEIRKLPGNLTPLSFNNQHASYVIQDANTRAIISELKSRLTNYGVLLLGRFAEWEYYNMDAAMGAAMDLVDEHFTG